MNRRSLLKGLLGFLVAPTVQPVMVLQGMKGTFSKVYRALDPLRIIKLQVFRRTAQITYKGFTRFTFDISVEFDRDAPTNEVIKAIRNHPTLGQLMKVSPGFRVVIQQWSVGEKGVNARLVKEEICEPV